VEHKKILLVEDRDDDIELILEALKENRIKNKVTIARDGQEAIDYIKSLDPSDDLPAIILLDLKLPKVDGLEVLKTIRKDKNTKLIPVIILTSSKEEKDLLKGYELGCNSYVRKPIDFKEFTEAVKNLGLYWLIINEIPPKKQG